MNLRLSTSTDRPLEAAVRYSCPRCGRRNAYGGDPYACSRCGFDGRTVEQGSMLGDLAALIASTALLALVGFVLAAAVSGGLR